jgi:amino acid adenylation domain-containing protein
VLSFEIGEATSAVLRQIGRQRGTTLYMTLLAAFNLLLHRYSGQTDIAVGTPIASRNRAEIEGLIGFFVNTLVIRTDLSGNPTFLELLKRVRDVALDAYAHQDLPFERLVEQLRPERSLSHSPLFQVMMSLDNEPVAGLRLGETRITVVGQENRTAKFDLSLRVIEGGARIRAAIEYNTDLLDRETISRMIGHFEVLVEGVVANPDQPISNMPMLTAAEVEELKTWNKAKTKIEDQRCIHHLYEDEVTTRPDAVAIVFAEQRLSYAELNRRANRLAWYLKKEGVRPEALVGIFMERTCEMVVGLLGILKAGGGYLPLDPLYPQERLANMLQHAGARIVISQSSLLHLLPPCDLRVICVDANADAISKSGDCNPSHPDASNLAYTLYTSGSTGRPKGVAIEHRSVTALSKWAGQYFEAEKLDGILGATSLCFDLSVFELLVPLSLGGKVVIAENSLTLADLLGRSEVTLVNTVPSVMTELIRSSTLPESVRTVNLAGEQLPKELVEELYRLENIEEVINLYGPSEDTTYSTCAILNRGDQRLPGIGQPIAETQVYILDDWLRPAPVGVKGEIYIGGVGQARGYLKRPALTAEFFIPDPFCEVEGRRLYKTGDLARYRPDGDIEFLGRKDHQVKIRGFRIELGEIEAALRENPDVIEAIVAPHKSKAGYLQLVAYILWNDGSPANVSELKDATRKKLPDYMIPTAYVTLEDIPLTSSGKIDRRALPPPDKAHVNSRDLILPRDSVELRLVQIWEEVLSIQPIGLEDNFFELGGHSLIAVQLIIRIQQEFEEKLPLAALFQRPTVESLASLIRQKTNKAPTPSLVRIQSRGHEQPFFCVHPMGGSVFCYTALAHCLGPGQPFYSLQAQGLDGAEPVHTRIEDMAAHYINALKEIQRNGPYLLGGWSMGGVVAFEMARQLEERGDHPGLVILMDARNPFLDHDLKAGDDDEAAQLEGFALQIGVPHQSLAAHRDRLFKSKPEAHLTLILEHVRTARALPGDIDLSQLKNLLDVYISNVRALRTYKPQRIRGRVVLLKAAESRRNLGWDATLGWKGLAAEGVDVREVPGNHFSMMHFPNISHVAEQLATCILKTPSVASLVNEVAIVG